MKNKKKDFYCSPYWKELRKQYLDTLEDNTCQRCKERVGSAVHHKIKRDNKNNNPQPKIDVINNLEFLCRLCHLREHHSTYKFPKLESPGETFLKKNNPELFQGKDDILSPHPQSLNHKKDDSETSDGIKSFINLFKNLGA
jgi:5-methylcytosine-specific restriction enzyme A